MRLNSPKSYRPYGGLKDVEIAGKTGTTQDNTDGWFMGVVPKLVTAVWVGADDPVVSFRSTRYGQGAHMALPIYGYFLNNILDDETLDIKRDDKFKEPEGRMRIETDCEKYNQQNNSPYGNIYGIQ